MAESGLSKEVIAQQFKLFDKDNDGRLNTGEFGELLAAVGMPLSPQDVVYLMEVLDTDKNGTIELNELEAFLLKPAEKDKKEELREIFDDYDAAKKGFITKSDFEEFLRRNPEGLLSDTEIEAAKSGLEAFLAKGNTNISWDDFIDIIDA